MSRKTFLFLGSLLLIFGLLITACSNASGSNQTHYNEMSSLADMPMDVQSAPQVVQAAYLFAVANPDVLTQLPCYCGCGSMGHSSNYSCYVAGENSASSLIYDNHALGCSICVDITQDAMRLLDEDKPLTEIRSYVDRTYSAFGPSNMP